MNKPLYEQDFVRWSEEQAHALRAAAAMRLNVPLDWENLAEEIESLGRSQRSELGSRIQIIVEHLMKLQTSPAKAPRRGWEATVVRERGTIEDLLDLSPSLRNAVPELVARAVRLARRVVERELADRGELAKRLANLDYSPDQVLGEWLPD